MSTNNISSQTAVKKYTNAELNQWKREINAGPIVASRISLHRENTEYVALCPFHQEKTPSFKVYKLDDGTWGYKCFGCGECGNVFQFIQRFDKITFGEAVEKVLALAGTIDPNVSDAQAEPKKIVTFSISDYEQAERALQDAPVGQDWITARGITMDTARRFHLGFVEDATAMCGTSHPWAKLGWVTFPTLAEDGNVTAVKYRSVVAKKDTIDDKSVSGILRAKNTATSLFNLGEASAMDDVFIVEGEPDTMIISQAGIPCVGLPSAEYKISKRERDVLLSAQRRFLAGDSDESGRKAMDKLQKQFPDDTFRIEWPNNRKDANDTFLNECGGDEENFSELLEELKLKALQKPTTATNDKQSNIATDSPKLEQMISRVGNTIKPKRIQWLWKDRIPLGKISLFAGNPDNGKSLAANSVAATCTTGRNFPESQNIQPASDVLMMLGEDDLEDTAVPRLMAAGADMSKIHFLEGVARQTMDDDVRLDIDLPMVEAKIQEHPDARLLIIDPISNYLGDVSMIAEQDVRSVLIPIKKLAEKYGIAVLMVMHLNKKSEMDAISRVGGAMAFIGVARCSWMFTRDEPNEDGSPSDGFSMTRIKNNLVKASSGGLKFRVTDTQIPMPDGEKPVYAPYVAWGDVIQKTADDALAARHNNPGRPKGTDHKLQTAIEFVQEVLANGRRDSKEVLRDAKEMHGLSIPTLRRAYDHLRVITTRGKGDGAGKYWVELPNSASGQPEPEPSDTDTGDASGQTEFQIQ